MAAVVDVQLGVRDARGQDTAVGPRDQRVLIAGEHKGALADERQQRQNPSAAVCWYGKPMLSWLTCLVRRALASASGLVFALPPHKSP